MAVDFPSSPTNGQTYSYNNRTWTYNTTLTAWRDTTSTYPSFATNFSVTGLIENTNVVASAATGTINVDVKTSAVWYYTVNATANFTLNVRGNSSTSLNTVMANSQSLTITFLNTNGTSAFYPTVYQIDGVAVTPKWVGGTAPTAGNASSIDSYTLTIIKTASATYTVIAAQTKFA